MLSLRHNDGANNAGRPRVQHPQLGDNRPSTVRRFRTGEGVGVEISGGELNTYDLRSGRWLRWPVSDRNPTVRDLIRSCAAGHCPPPVLADAIEEMMPAASSFTEFAKRLRLDGLRTVYAGHQPPPRPHPNKVGAYGTVGDDGQVSWQVRHW